MSTWHRMRPWALVIVCALAACGASFWVGSHVRSPWEQARQNASTPVVANAEVVDGALSPEVSTVTGQVSLGQSFPVTVEGAAEGTRLVVTRQLVSVGDIVGSGTRLIEVADRPLIALQIPFPLYRDLAYGDQGSDVEAVQRALSDLGWYSNQIDGVFGAGTQEAVRRLYHAAGAAPAKVREQDALALVEAQDALAELSADPDQPAGTGELAHARELVGERAAKASTWLPAAEIVAISAPAAVVSVAPVGTVLTEATPAVELRADAPSVSARVMVSQVADFAVGASVTVTTVGEAPLQVPGVVAGIGGFTPEEDESPAGYDLTVSLTDASALVDGDQVTVASAVAPEEVEGLVVPLAAIRDRSGELYVEVIEGDPARVPVVTRDVTVQVVISAQGMAVIDVEGLSAGDRVVVE